jgi:hypothetical protein
LLVRRPAKGLNSEFDLLEMRSFDVKKLDDAARPHVPFYAAARSFVRLVCKELLSIAEALRVIT